MCVFARLIEATTSILLSLGQLHVALLPIIFVVHGKRWYQTRARTAPCRRAWMAARYCSETCLRFSRQRPMNGGRNPCRVATPLNRFAAISSAWG
jgi:hypothetical protein